MLALLFQTLGITAPVFSMLFIGVLLRRVGWIDQGFIQTASALVFNATMPVMLFLGIYHSDLHRAASPAVLTFFCLATLGGFLLAWGWALWRVPREERGVYVQGAFRGNNGIVGLALATSLYGEHGLALGSVLAALVILCYNTLATVVLAIYSPVLKSDPLSIARQVLLNPLILGVLAAFPFAWWGIRLPAWVLTSGDYFAQMTLPLALVCIGGTLSLPALRSSGSLALSASLMKMVWLPALCTVAAWLCGFRGAELGVLFLYFASPTAAASYVMARAAQGNAELAASIIVITTLAAALTTNLGLFILQWGGWI
ncbi:AEC family transporter [Pseudomonas sp. RW407]|uniref:AEC family transporter n=1 Tax=Pseudomonas sp. RW407 TaxID=2202894 RepID=UPI000D6ED1E7|nr:AEC family transporter [Pseudomonas sp. RW407]PWU31931.1 AEC family transporter [Pseudomonas sp. RW407]